MRTSCTDVIIGWQIQSRLQRRPTVNHFSIFLHSSVPTRLFLRGSLLLFTCRVWSSGGARAAAPEEGDRDPSRRFAAHPEGDHRDPFLRRPAKGANATISASLCWRVWRWKVDQSCCCSPPRLYLLPRPSPWASTCQPALCSSPALASLMARVTAL